MAKLFSVPGLSVQPVSALLWFSFFVFKAKAQPCRPMRSFQTLMPNAVMSSLPSHFMLPKTGQGAWVACQVTATLPIRGFIAVRSGFSRHYITYFRGAPTAAYIWHCIRRCLFDSPPLYMATFDDLFNERYKFEVFIIYV